MNASHGQDRRCWAEIDLEAIRRNAGVARAKIGPDAGIMAIVKANAYGHGVAPVVQALRDRVEMFGVANVREAAEVRRALPGARIFLLSPALAEEREEIVRNGYIAPVSTYAEAAEYSALDEAGAAEVHLAIDTGMGRIGVLEKEALDFVHAIARLPLKIAGIATHLPVADEDEDCTLAQLERFQALSQTLSESGLAVPLIHSLNSAGILHFPRFAAGMVRAGLMLYGSSPLSDYQSALHPALAFKTRVTLVRELPAGHGISYGSIFVTPAPMRVATLAAGYADGYPRHLSTDNETVRAGRGAAILIGGKRCPLLGRVTMDQIMADVTHLPATAEGDEAVLIGRQGGEEILASELAQKAGTIAWEIFTGLGARVERIYLHQEGSSEKG